MALADPFLFLRGPSFGAFACRLGPYYNVLPARFGVSWAPAMFRGLRFRVACRFRTMVCPVSDNSQSVRRESASMIARWAPVLVALAILPCLAACSRNGVRKTSSDRLVAFVTIQPQAFVVQRVGGERVSVNVMVSPGQSYHTYEPTPLQVAALAEARVYFGIGIPLERALRDKLASTDTGVEFVDTCKDIPLRPGVECAHDHDHAVHDHAGEGDPHTWLSPRLMRIQAGVVAEAMTRLDPAGAEIYATSLAELQRDLDAVDERIARRLAPYSGRSFFVFHPSFGYFADAYGLLQVSVEKEGKEPSAKHLAEVVEQARQAGVKVIFVQPQFASASATAVAREIGASVDTLDPLAADYIANLERIADKIARSFEAADRAGDVANVR